MTLLRPLWHLGPLHPVEQLLTLGLAFGPFVVLGIVIWLRQRSYAAEDADGDAAANDRAVRGTSSETSQDAPRTARPD